MTNKTWAIIAGLIIVAAVGYFAFMRMDQKDAMSSPTGADASQGKINIDEVCNGALAYMTFTDGASADAFVSECKEGKHPEVIEKYKADMNLGAGAAI